MLIGNGLSSATYIDSEFLSNMKKNIIVFGFLLSFFLSGAQALSVAWTKNAGAAGRDIAMSQVLDATGNIYVTGKFEGTVDFDPGPGLFNLTSAGAEDVFVLKLDTSGNFVWVKALGGSNGEVGWSINLDASGNIYTAGLFSGAAEDFDPGTGVFNLPYSGQQDIFISKLDPSGNFLWAKSIGGAGIDMASAVTIDSQDNIVLTGYYSGTVDFDPSITTYTLGNNSLGVGFSDIFVLKLNFLGNFVWAKGVGGVANDAGKGITTDQSGNVYMIGSFVATADFDPGPGINNITSLGAEESCILKLDASGNYLWAKIQSGPGQDIGYSIKISTSGNIYTCGLFGSTADFDPGPGSFTISSNGGYDIFVSKLDPAGNFLWARGMGGTSFDVANSLAIDAFDNVYLTGSFFGTVDFNPGTAIFNLTSSGSRDIFILRLNAQGNFDWGGKMGGFYDDMGYSMNVDAAGNVYTAGCFQNTSNFNPFTGTITLISAGAEDLYVQKINQCTLLTASITPSHVSCNNGNNGWAVINATGSSSYQYHWTPGGVQLHHRFLQAVRRHDQAQSEIGPGVPARAPAQSRDPGPRQGGAHLPEHPAIRRHDGSGKPDGGTAQHPDARLGFYCHRHLQLPDLCTRQP